MLARHARKNATDLADRVHFKGGWPLTTGHRNAGRLRMQSPFGPAFQFIVSRDKLSTVAACHRRVVFQRARVDQGGTATSATFEVVH